MSLLGIEADDVVTIGDEGYESLAAAVSVASKDDAAVTITLIKDIEMTNADKVTIQNGQNIILDMGGTAESPGHKITAASDFDGRAICNYGTLTIQGFGTIDVSASSKGYGPIDNYGTITIQNGTFRGNLQASGANIWNRTGGTMTINGGTFDTNGTTVSTAEGSTLHITGGYFESPWYPALENRGNAVVDGGTFVNTSCSSCDTVHWGYAVRNGYGSENAYLRINNANVTGTQGGVGIIGGTADIYGGVFETVDCENQHGAVFYALYVAGESFSTSTTVYNGTFSSEKREAVHVGNNNAGGDGGNREHATLEIYGGTFSGGTTATDKAAVMVDEQLGGIQIKGGTFSSSECKGAENARYSLSQYLAPGFELVDDGQGGWGIKAPKIAEIDEITYPSIEDAIKAADEGDVIKLLEGTNECFAVPADKEVTLDLNGKIVTTSSIIAVEGDLTIIDSTATVASEVSDDYETVTYVSGKITSSGSAIQAQNGGTITLKSGTIESAAGNGMNVLGNVVPGGESVVSTINVAGGYVHSREYGIGVFGNAGTLNVSGGVIVADDNGAIAGNGTVNAVSDQGGTAITISGGTIIGHIVTSGYIAMGIYHPQAGTLEITGGTIYADGGAGIVMRAGKLSMSGSATVIAMGEAQGWGGDSKYSLPSAGIVYDTNAGYPGMSEGNNAVAITGGTVRSDAANPIQVIAPEDQTANFTCAVSGGTFSGKFDETLLADGFELVKNAQGGFGVESIDKGQGSGGVAVSTWTVTFDPANEGASNPTQSLVEHGDTVSCPDDPQWAGHIFMGWYVGEGEQAKLYDFDSPVTGNLILTAKWATPAELVMEMIAALSDSEGITFDNYDGVRAAREAYEALSDEDKALVTNYDQLVEAEEMLDVVLQAGFGDVEGHWAVSEGWIYRVTNAGLMFGISNSDGSLTGRFDPNGLLTRGQVVTMLYRHACTDDPDLIATYGSTTERESYSKFDNPAFSDDEPNMFYTAALEWAYDEGIVTGDQADDGTTPYPTTVRMEDPVSRQELATLIYRYAVVVSGADPTGNTAESFAEAPDANEVMDYAEAAMGWCYYNKVLTGSLVTDELNPLDTATRAEAAKMAVVGLVDVLG